MTAGLCPPVARPAGGDAQLWHTMTRMRLTCEQETFSWYHLNNRGWMRAGAWKGCQKRRKPA
jgi:hypothetical protein